MLETVLNICLDVWHGRLDSYGIVEESGIQVATMCAGKEFHISFAATNEDRDWMRNFLITKRTPHFDDERLKVHAGWYDGYMDVRHEIHNLVRACDQDSQIERIVVSGYSMGAALAYLCAVDIRRCFGDDVCCITFGGPKVGNSAFGRYYNRQGIPTWRYVAPGDIVPWLPPFFSHCAKKTKTRKGFRLPFPKNHLMDTYYNDIRGSHG